MKIFNEPQQVIANRIKENSTISHWKDWKWQLRNTIKTIDQFEFLTGIRFTEDEKENLKETLDKFPLSVTPYYASLIDEDNYQNDPVFKQAMADSKELIVLENEMADPLSEESDSPVEGITHRYPDRVLFHVSNICSMYCRHCTRKRKVGDHDFIPSKEQLAKGIEYVRNNPVVRDVLLSGGDPFMLSDEKIDWLLSALSSIPHVEIIRIGTRMPVVLPYRITDNLVQILKKYQPVWINTHFNHPRELTSSAKEAVRKLADGGFPLGNQTVLLADVNDCPRIMKKLVQKLVENRIRPYYLYQCDLSEGLSHFRTPVGKGIEIMESLIGHTSGFAVPTYVIDAPGGGGKIPVMPNYLISWSTNKVVLRNYEGVITTYKEPEHYENKFCDRDCSDCKLELNLQEGDEFHALGIEKLLSDENDSISLIPENNDRHSRRKV
ncbi:lysine 2,3-aminomutase [Mangrovibacterium lignilyticum]|uniref:lysine 2,3-aminomutase n=1 Tax=Mangrovibacterium lignilyticum TaxID=2668052 RepID=UPI0013D81F91|nr:lysine 2,3-aminomutase [Mangrovibacterium lignilyticum]